MHPPINRQIVHCRAVYALRFIESRNVRGNSSILERMKRKEECSKSTLSVQMSEDCVCQVLNVITEG